jgi:hypothetical protein
LITLEDRRTPTAQKAYATRLSSRLNPLTAGDYDHYREDPVGFARDILHIHTLTGDQVSLMESVVDYKKTVVESATTVGKTFVLAIICLWFYKTGGDDVKVYSCAAPPEDNLRHLLWGEIYALVNRNPGVFKDDHITSSMYIGRGKSHIKGVLIPKSSSDEMLQTTFSGKHAARILFVADEADNIPDPVFRGIDGCLSGGHARLVACLNPKRREGEAYRLTREHKARHLHMSAFSHPNVITGKSIIPGGVSRESVVTGINEWAEWIPEEKVEKESERFFQLPEYLVEATAIAGNGREYIPLRAGWYRIIDPMLATTVLGIYPPDAGGSAIRQEWLDQAASLWMSILAMNSGEIKPPVDTRPNMGYDVSGEGVDSHSLATRYQTWLAPLESWNDANPDESFLRVAKKARDANVALLAIDITGVGAAGPSRIANIDAKLPVVGVHFAETSSGYSEFGAFKYVKDEATWLLREDLRQGKLAIPPEDHSFEAKRLHEALRKVAFFKNGNFLVTKDKTKMTKELGYSPDELEAVILTYVPPRVWMGGI